ncbi:MAG: thioredoxin family protein [Panacagrimonas sp.]
MRSVVAILLLCIPALLSRVVLAEEADRFAAARAQAAERRVPLLVDFRAPWCYSCYYMARNVHTGAPWAALQRRAVILELDADSPEGAARMKAWNVKALPSYVLFDDQGQELGRILGEQRREAFYARLDELIGRSNTLEQLRVVATRGGRSGTDAATEALAAFHARRDAQAGLKWFYDLPGKVRRTYESNAALTLRLARLRLMQAAEVGNAASCLVIAPEVLDGDLGCERPYELSRVQACLANKPEVDAFPELLRTQRQPMEQLVERGVFGGAGRACADQRSAVLGLADIYTSLDDRPASERLLRRAIANLSARMGDSIGQDRNLADDLRAYIEAAGDWPAYDALMPRLVAAWPDDYVYAFRFGRSLLERDRASEALPYLERAASKAYGVNRLKVAEQHVRALKRLDNGEQARRVAAEALQANGPWFPEEALKLRSEL